MKQELSLPREMPVFFQPWWLDATGLSWQLAATHNGDALSGLWPVFPEKKFGISFQRNPPLCPYLGPCAFFPPDLKASKQESFEHQTIQALLKQLPPAQIVATALLPGLKQAGLFTQAGYEVNVRQTFLMDLKEISEEALRSRLHEDYRRNLRKAAGEMEIIDAPEEIRNLYRFQEATLARKGRKISYSLSYLQNLFEAAHTRGQAALWAARKDGVVQALVWHLWDEKRAYYLVGAQNPEVENKRALTALIFHAMNTSRAAGKETFDFEGSMDPGVEHFFRHFGGRKELYLVLEKNDSALWKIKKQIQQLKG